MKLPKVIRRAGDRHLPKHLLIMGFGLWQGATLWTGPTTNEAREQVDSIDGANELWVVMYVNRDHDSEMVYVTCRMLGDASPYYCETFQLAYTEPVRVVGSVINFLDPEDNNFNAYNHH